MQVDLAVVVQVAVNIALLVAAIAGLVVWLRRWLQKQVVDPAKEVSQQVMPNGGSQESTRHLIEQMYERFDELTDASATNRDIATSAKASADLAHRRLDEHISHHLKEI